MFVCFHYHPDPETATMPIAADDKAKQVFISADVHHRAKVHAATIDITLRRMIDIAITVGLDYMERQPQQQQKPK